MQMRALTYTGLKAVEVQEIPVPHCSPGEVLLRVDAVGICGSDLGGYLGHHARRQPPLVLGHEAAGVIVEVGTDAHRTRPGDRVCVNPLFTCGECPPCREGRANLCGSWRLLGMDRLQGAMAEYVCVPESAVRPLAPGTTAEQGAWVEPLACAVHLLSAASARPFSSLLIVGAGTLGALLAMLARRLGFGPLIVADINDSRLSAVRQAAHPDATVHASAGNEAIIQECRRLTDGYGVELAVDAVGNQSARETAVAACRAGGSVMLLGLAEACSSLEFVDVVRREIHVAGSFAYTDRDFDRAQRLVESGQIDLSPWMEVQPLESGAAAFQKLTTDPGSTLKIVLRPQSL